MDITLVEISWNDLKNKANMDIAQQKKVENITLSRQESGKYGHYQQENGKYGHYQQKNSVIEIEKEMHLNIRSFEEAIEVHLNDGEKLRHTFVFKTNLVKYSSIIQHTTVLHTVCHVR